jgi:hypothetical protein
MYDFVLRKYKNGDLTKEQVYQLVPLFLSQGHADEIVNTPKP